MIARQSLSAIAYDIEGHPESSPDEHGLIVWNEGSYISPQESLSLTPKAIARLACSPQRVDSVLKLLIETLKACTVVHVLDMGELS